MNRVILNHLASAILVVLVILCCILDGTVLGLSSTSERGNSFSFIMCIYTQLA